jgi:hypothetical protein
MSFVTAALGKVGLANMMTVSFWPTPIGLGDTSRSAHDCVCDALAGCIDKKDPSVDISRNMHIPVTTCFFEICDNVVLFSPFIFG